MKVLLVALNAKYPHTNPAVRSIAAFCRGLPDEVSFCEHTVNQRPDDLLALLYEQRADVYVFSCYIWNIELVRRLAADLQKIRPDADIWAGGPEVSYGSVRFLQQNPAFQLVMRGEGEPILPWLLLARRMQATPASVPAVTWRDADGMVQENGAAAPPDLDSLPFPYRDLDALQGRVIYCESMRGCPFRCGYCLSSVEDGVRFRALPLVRADLQQLLDAGVPRVKFVDRTFNCDRARALELWQFLAEHDNGVTNFHFELAGELLDDETLTFLETVRPGLFQFEIGVQSCNGDTLREIRRPAGLDALSAAVRRLRDAGNIHLHLDLIAGLPLEDMESFAGSFNRVYALRPHQLQLGFLKILHGSAMEQRAGDYGIVYRDTAPYEVLQTRWLTYEELQRLHGVEEMLERYHNSGRFSLLVEALCAHFPSPFVFYDRLAECWKALGHHLRPPDKTGHYAFLGAFQQWAGIPVTEREQWLCRFDMMRYDRMRRLPDWVEADLTAPHRRQIRAFLADAQQLARHLPGTDAGEVQIERFPFHPLTGAAQPVFLAFDYSRRDALGHARITPLPDCIFGC